VTWSIGLSSPVMTTTANMNTNYATVFNTQISTATDNYMTKLTDSKDFINSQLQIHQTDFNNQLASLQSEVNTNVNRQAVGYKINWNFSTTQINKNTNIN